MFHYTPHKTATGSLQEYQPPAPLLGLFHSRGFRLPHSAAMEKKLSVSAMKKADKLVQSEFDYHIKGQSAASSSLLLFASSSTSPLDWMSHFFRCLGNSLCLLPATESLGRISSLHCGLAFQYAGLCVSTKLKIPNPCELPEPTLP